MSALALAQDEDDIEPIELVFPPIPCNHRPFGQYVIVQIRQPKDQTKGRVILSEMDKDTERDNTVVGKVVAIGAGAFKRRDDGTDWPEGPWFGIGDYVRCPKYGGDRWQVRFTRRRGARQIGAIMAPPTIEHIKVEFAVFKDLDLRAGVDDPLAVEAYF